MLPALRSWGVETSPFDALLDLHRNLNRWMDFPFRGGNGSRFTEWYGRTVPAEVVETEDELRIFMEIPGVSPEDVDVTVENRVLTVSGETRDEPMEAGYRRWLGERRFGSFQRSFRLPEYVDADEVDAHFEDGVLAMTLPKVEEAKPRRIQIGSGGRKRLFSGKGA